MKHEVLDTNVLLRFLVGDNREQRTRAEHWFREAEEGKRAIVVIPLVVAEASFVLETFYKHNRDDIAKALGVFLSQEWLYVQERGALLGLLQWYRQGLHFVDSFLLAWISINRAGLLSFDKNLIKKRRA